jgi:chromosome segregation ATPase
MKTVFYKVYIACFFGILFSAQAWGQVIDAIDVQLTIRQKVAEHVKALPNAQLVISDIGTVKTDDLGMYSFTYPVRNEVDPVISISLISDEHKLLKPIDGAIELDANRDEMKIDFVVVNMDVESEEFKKRINDLEKRISGLQAQNRLTKHQLNALNSTLVDTILYYEANRQALESKIDSYKDLTQEQQSEINTLKTEIAGLESKVDQLTQDLEVALEEKYLRQNAYFKNISSNLIAYLRKSKDIRDHLPFISTYYNSASGYQNYDKDIRAYNEVWETLDNNRNDYLEGVSRYWENTRMSNQLEDVFSYLMKGIHQSQILKVVNDVNVELHKQKPKKAQKIATMAHEDMTINIRTLEKRINRMLSLLRKNT